ncbi:MAG: hypothetical protein AAGJ94_09960 [Pseudomonadota bacterium]
MRVLIFAVLGVALIGCQSARFGSGVDGQWSADDGSFVATFDNGAFTSRLTSTGETVVFDGRYSSTGNGLALAWTSVGANERRSADCTFSARNRLSCVPSVGTAFSLTKV